MGLHSICNRSTLKVCYSCMLSMGSITATQNSKILKSATNQPKPVANCNCKPTFKPNCPMSGECNQDGTIYQATVKTNNGKLETYTGLAKNFKKRYGKHKKCLGDKPYKLFL